MNKTVSINLGGQIFQIDENAFEKLRNYLESIRSRFSGTIGSEEIIADIESRIAEMFSEKLSGKKQVVVLADVEQMIGVMGRPEDFEMGEEDDDEPATSRSRKKHRRLYRNPDDKVLGGVCSGLSAYLGINDPLWLRLIFLLAFFFGVGGSFIVYIILWIIMPEAITPSEKLEMKGERINISNIEKTLKKDLNDLSEKLHSLSSKEQSQKAKNVFERIVELFVDVVTFLFRLIIKLTAIVLVVAGIAIVVGIVMSLLVLIGVFGFALPPLFPILFSGKVLMVIAITGLFLLIGVPAFTLVYLGFRIMFGMTSRIRSLGSGLAGLWAIGWIFTILAGVFTAADFSERETVRQEVKLKQPNSDVLILDVNRLAGMQDREAADLFGWGEFLLLDNQVVIKERIKLDVKRSLTDNFELVQLFESSGQTKVKAYARAEGIDYGWMQEDSIIFFNDYFSIKSGDSFRGQKINMVVKVPMGKSVYLAHSSRDIIYDIKNATDTYDGHMVGHTWTMLEEGLTCVDCNWLEERRDFSLDKDKVTKTFDYEDFEKVEIEGSFALEIKQGSDFSIKVSGEQKFVDHVEVTLVGDQLSIKTDRKLSDLFKRHNNQGEVAISLPTLKNLEISGANTSNISGFDEDVIKIQINGASKSKIKLDAETLDFQVNGASTATVIGMGGYFSVSVNGASRLNAFDYKVKTCKIDVSGASNADINVRDELDAQASGASNINYKGLPKISSDVTGFSSMKPEQ